MKKLTKKATERISKLLDSYGLFNQVFDSQNSVHVPRETFSENNFGAVYAKFVGGRYPIEWSCYTEDGLHIHCIGTPEDAKRFKFPIPPSAGGAENGTV